MEVPFGGVCLLVQVASAAWQQLSPDARKAVRAASCGGRHLHDSLLKHLRLSLDPPQLLSFDWHNDGDAFDFETESRPAATPMELRTCVAGMLRRGARVQGLTLAMYSSDSVPQEQREQQLLAVLDAIRSFPLPQLKLMGVVPISEAVADALVACCQHLTQLTIDHDRVDQQLPRDQPGNPGSGRAGFSVLLSRLGPRLRELEVLGGARHWPTEAWSFLCACTRLTSLTLEAGVSETEYRDGVYLEAVWHEASILKAVGQLRSLQSLCLRTVVDPRACTPQHIAPHAASVMRLSALTSLTRLEFQPSSCYADRNGAWSMLELDGQDRHAWRMVREVHRGALLDALRAMPLLQHLRCPTLGLRQPDAAPLTALTSLTLGGLLPSQPLHEEGNDGNAVPVGAHGSARSGAGGANSSGEDKAPPALWPPRLQELMCDNGASPQALAALRLPGSLRRFSCPVLRLGVLDLQAGRHITQRALEALGPAVRLLTNPATLHAEDSVEVVVDGGPELLQPRMSWLWGHAGWLGQLAGLDVFRGVKLKGVALHVGDVHCLVRTWPNVRWLELRHVSMPVAALPALAGLARARLEWLTVDLCDLGPVDQAELAAALCLMLEGANGGLVDVTVLANVPDSAACELDVLAQLRQWGTRIANLTVMHRDNRDDEYR